MRLYYLLLFLFFSFFVSAQKKPLNHSVYDGWQSIGERMVSNDGKWVVYNINPQEGDNDLIIQSSDAQYKKTIARGYNAKITEDSRFIIFKIKPFYKDTREAKIKKKKLDDFPKDSLAIIELGKDSIWEKARVKSYSIPEKSFGWVAYQLEKPLTDTSSKNKKQEPNNRTVDSLKRIIDSLRIANLELQNQRKNTNKDEKWGNSELVQDFADEEPSTGSADTGTDLILKKLPGGEEKTYNNILYYSFNKTARKLLLQVSRNPKDSLSKSYVMLYDVEKKRMDTLSRGGNDFKNFAISDDGMQVAYVAERDSSSKALQKFYRLWYFKEGMDSAHLIADRNSKGIKTGMTISENGSVSFSKTGKRLFFGTVPIQPPKDTTLADIDKVNVDIWNYKDDYLQTVQLNRLQTELKRTYLAVYNITNHSVQQLGSEEIPTVYETNEGDGETFVGVTDYGKRIESQWTGSTLKDIYAIHVSTGEKKLVKKDLKGVITSQYSSPSGKYILWYDSRAKNYFVYDGDSIKNITAKIKWPLYDEENDVPDDPNPYGVMKWQESDNAVFIYDRYGVWKVDPKNVRKPLLLIDNRKNKIQYRYVQVDPEERFIKPSQTLCFRSFDEKTKQSGFWKNLYDDDLDYLDGWLAISENENISIGQIVKSRDSSVFILTKESYKSSPNLYLLKFNELSGKRSTSENLSHVVEKQLSFTNPQQKDYSWGTAELFKWKAYNGKETMGIVYKPEDFDPKKKYPMICYFYETLSDGLNNYLPPSPTPSRLNIPFFVSRGYIVFAPDIHYGTGHPGRDAYNHIVSGARALVKQGFVDSTKIGIQGQSWGGYQVTYLITATNLFKAAWAGAPVANMTSAYGGIRWESGLNRQFQYEKSQSRIGASLWEKPQLYIENSPLFHLPKVKTPLVIMSNDADGAVPWYQGIELFTAMRRLGKQVWLLDYNGEAHNLVERKNRKDIQVREQQYFDWLLKGEKPPKWITEGVPAVKKGKDWGFQF
ncbi:MAG TPA: prolyl oligopeptidase family serine peptidase [Chitinophagaceae bacterium]|jgi:dipeptidyl aminopeptidase/acylaminoacyl peptidase|nr:prolyl oligopeptidase family serine peptidase [Chitinophagaceae bacterium]